MAARAKALAAFKLKAAAHDSLQARTARLASRLANHGLSAAAARGLARATFPEALTSPVWAPLALRSGEHFDSYVNDFVARIVRDGKVPLLAKTFVPMRDTDSDGNEHRVDLGLESQGTVYTSANPLVDVSIAKNASDGLRFEKSGITIAPVGVADVAGAITDDRVMAENVATDTDQIIEPTPTGAQFSWQLRSQDSPESARLHFTIPAGAILRLQNAPAVDGHTPDKQSTEAIVERDGDVIARVDAPKVADADGTNVSSWYEVDGEDLIMRFPHRGQDLKYPLLADPQVTETWSTNDWNANDTWSSSQVGSVPFSFARNCCGRNGLQIGLYQYAAYNYGANGEWDWNTYPNSYVARADFSGLDQIDTGNSLYTGIVAPGYGYESAAFDYGTFNGYAHTHYGSRDNSQVRFGAFSESGNARTQNGLVSMSGMTLYLGDNHPPTIQATSQSYDTTRWTNASSAGVRLIAHDDGLGLKALGVARTDQGDPNAGTATSNYWLSLISNDFCQGNRRARCINDYDTASYSQYPNGRLQYNLSALPEGINTVRASVHEIAGGTYGNAVFGPAWTAKIDRTPPAVSYTGPLPSLDNHLDTSGEQLFDLHVAATDGDASSDAARRSGVSSISLKIDNDEVARTDTPLSCTDSCPADLDYTFNYDYYAPGSTHTITVLTTDRFNLSITKTYHVTIPQVSDYEALVSSWKASVETKVDAANPLPLTGPMPAVPTDFRSPEACEASAAAVTACYDRTRQWTADVDKWLNSNALPVTRYSDLPDLPTYGWAPDLFATDLSSALADGFDAVRQAYAGGSGSLRVALTFATPQTPQQVTTLLGASLTPAPSVLKGVFEPAGYAVTGQADDSSLASLQDHITGFYAAQANLASQEAQDLQDEMSSPASGPAGSVSLDSDDIAARQMRRDQDQRQVAALNASQPFVTAVTTTLPAVQLRTILLLPNSLLSAAIRTITAATPTTALFNDAGLLDETLSGSYTSDEEATWSAARRGETTPREAAAQSYFSTAGTSSASGSGTRAAAINPVLTGKTCDQVDSIRSTANYDPATFMPNRESAKVALDGPAQDQGRHNKVSQLYMRWVRRNSLSWFCGDNPGKRAFEPDTKPVDNGIVNNTDTQKALPRWSSNWTDSNGRTTLPGGYRDDLACGNHCDNATSFKHPSTYPDFAYGSSQARSLAYNLLYSSRFQTNIGDVDSGQAYVRGQQNTFATTTGEVGYCANRSGRSSIKPEYCFFGKGTYKTMTVNLRDPAKHVAYGWLTAGDTPPDSSDTPLDFKTTGTGEGSDAP